MIPALPPRRVRLRPTATDLVVGEDRTARDDTEGDDAGSAEDLDRDVVEPVQGNLDDLRGGCVLAVRDGGSRLFV